MNTDDEKCLQLQRWLETAKGMEAEIILEYLILLEARREKVVIDRKYKG